MRGGDDDELFEAIARAFARDRSVTRGRRFSTNNVLSVEAKIFCFVSRGRFVAKLPRARVEALVEDGTGENFAPSPGRIMKEWIAIRDLDDDEAIGLAREAHAFVKRGAKK